MSFKKIITNNAYLFIIIIIGIAIRLFGIKDVGINDYDTAYYANIAKVPIFTLDWFFVNDADHRNLESLRDYLINRGCGVNIIKPGHVFLIFLSFLIFGVTDYAVLAVSVICSVGVIILTYIIGYKLFNKSVGLIGSAIIAVSSQSIIYSRTGYPQADTTLLFCIAFLFIYYHLNSFNREKYFWYSAVLSGLLLLFHQSSIIALGSLLIAMFFNFMISHDKKLSDCFSDCIYFISIIIMILLLSNFTIEYINNFNPGSGQELSKRLYNTTISRAIGYFGISSDKLFFYPRMFWILEGPLLAILIPLSIVYITWKSYKTKLINFIIIFLVTLIPLLFWIINYTTLKGIQVLMPFIAICVGIAGYDFFKKINQYINNTILYNQGNNFFITIILFFGLLRSFPNISLKHNYNSAFFELEKYMKENGGQLNASQNNLWPITYFYAGNIVDNNPSQFSNNIIFNTPDAHSDYRIIDWAQFLYGKNDLNTLMDVDENYSPVIQKKYRLNAIPIYNYHRYYDVKSVPNLFKEYEQSHFISVYDLRKKRYPINSTNFNSY